MIYVCMFNHITLEQDIARLSLEVASKRKESGVEGLSEKTLIKESLRPLVKAQLTTAPQPVSASDDANEPGVLPSYLKDSSPEIKLKVEKLVDSVFHQGLGKAVKEAERAGEFVLDAFHDALADKLYDELKKRKLI